MKENISFNRINSKIAILPWLLKVIFKKPYFFLFRNYKIF